MKHALLKAGHLPSIIRDACTGAVKNRLRLATTATVLALAAGSSNAVAGSVLQPGGTVGLPAGAPLLEGIYFVDTSSYGQRTTTPSGLGVNLPQIVWATPLYFYDTRLQFIVLQPSAYTTLAPSNVFYLNSTLIAGQLAHTFGNGFSVSYMAGFRSAMPAPQAFQFNSFEQRLAVSYTASGWDLTANVINGLFGSGNLRYPDWLNVDLTATKKFDKFELGAVAFGSSDISSPKPSYKRQGQIAVGALVGYDFGIFKLQAYATRDVSERGYTGYDTRGWLKLIVPFYAAPQMAAAEPIRERY